MIMEHAQKPVHRFWRCVTAVLGLSIVGLTAEAQQSWTRFAGNPLITERGSFQPEVVVVGGTYHMYYTDRSVIPEIIRHRTSGDGIAWGASAVVLQSGTAGAWDDDGVVCSAVLVEGGVFKMWYTGRGTTGPVNQIGYATSPDGVTWTKHPTPVMSVGGAGAWDSARVREATVVHLGSTYHMWYGGTQNHPVYRIGYATSPDGLVWTKNPANPVLTVGPAGAWDDDTVYAPQVVHHGGTFHMWYSAGDGTTPRNWQIGYATSCDQDGVVWVKDPANPVLGIGANPSWECGDSVDFNFVLDDNGVWTMYYSGSSSRCGGGDYQIGRAVLAGELPPGAGCRADLALDKSVDVATRVVGQNVVFTVTVTNLGGNCASDAVVSDLLPSGFTWLNDDSAGAYNPTTGLWTIPLLLPGSSVALHITATAVSTGTWVNTATVTSAVPDDPDTGNNTDSVTVTVQPPPEWAIPTASPAGLATLACLMLLAGLLRITRRI
ncbi:MAG: DUF11 domain-containing protein [Thermoanaerobaculaceae bacterium]|nr:DUF11 domain-containing protein [Thermoanaerobaculaceae bacterium]MDI9621030.1 hypothetical protein [Acidobacteriota bacterium]HPW55855.1 hypothetical protein [Thermoanaerobaculaceae bacterium]